MAGASIDDPKPTLHFESLILVSSSLIDDVQAVVGSPIDDTKTEPAVLCLDPHFFVQISLFRDLLVFFA